jgi:hypothetical protein
LVERVRDELGIDADLHSTLVVDQAAADQARFPGSPAVLVDGHERHPPCCEPRLEVGSVPDTTWPGGCGPSCAVLARMAWLLEAGGQRSRDAALAASRSLSPITVAPELTGRGGVGPQVALRSNSRKKS